MLEKSIGVHAVLLKSVSVPPPCHIKTLKSLFNTCTFRICVITNCAELYTDKKYFFVYSDASANLYNRTFTINSDFSF